MFDQLYAHMQHTSSACHWLQHAHRIISPHPLPPSPLHTLRRGLTVMHC